MHSKHVKASSQTLQASVIMKLENNNSGLFGRDEWRKTPVSKKHVNINDVWKTVFEQTTRFLIHTEEQKKHWF